MINIINNPVVQVIAVTGGATCAATAILENEMHVDRGVTGLAKKIENVYCDIAIGVLSTIIGVNSPPFSGN